MKAVFRENRISFELAQTTAPFFSGADMAYVKKIRPGAGKGTAHESEKIWSAHAWEDYLYWQMQDFQEVLNQRGNQYASDTLTTITPSISLTDPSAGNIGISEKTPV